VSSDAAGVALAAPSTALLDVPGEKFHDQLLI
jgi:hypothetical protein